MKQIYHVVLGLLGLIILAVAYLASKILAAFAPAEKKRSQPWLEKFIVLFFAKCFKLDGNDRDSTRLSRGQLDFREVQSLMVYLKAYLHKIGVTYDVIYLNEVLDSIPRVWAIHTVGYQSEAAVREWCQNQNPNGHKFEVDAFVDTVKNVDKRGEDWLHLSRELLMFRIERVFKSMHGANFYSYTDNMLEDYIALADANVT